MGIQEVTSKSVEKWFYGIMAVLILLFVVGLLINPLGTQLNVFFAKTDNLLADFFNVFIYSFLICHIISTPHFLAQVNGFEPLSCSFGDRCFSN